MAKLADATDLGSVSERSVGSSPSPSTNLKTQEIIYMTINGNPVTAKSFAYDGCHKIYLIASKDEEMDATSEDYDIYPISKLQEKFEKSCSLRFISNWNLSKKDIAKQFEVVEFQN
jgi:hypothetical protein